MFKAINGWTKKKILKVLQNRRHARAAYDQERQVCEYRTKDGNRCAVGMFIPNGHEGLKLKGDVKELLKEHSDLRKKLPLSQSALASFQMVHDDHCNRQNAKQAMIKWVQRNVE